MKIVSKKFYNYFAVFIGLQFSANDEGDSPDVRVVGRAEGFLLLGRRGAAPVVLFQLMKVL
jgi:hypothetical protein